MTLVVLDEALILAQFRDLPWRDFLKWLDEYKAAAIRHDQEAP